MNQRPLSSGEPALRLWLARVLALCGLLAAGRLVVHLASHWVAVRGAQAWVMAHPTLSWSARVWALPMLAYGVLGAWLLITQRSLWKQAPYLVGSGVVAVLYAALHVKQLYDVQPGPSASTRAVYETLWVHAGQWPWLVAHVLGICAVSLHVSLGLPKALSVLTKAREGAARLLGVVCGLALLAFQVQLLSYFAIGQPLISIASQQSVESAHDDSSGF